MDYRIEAFKCKVNTVITLEDDMIPVGSVYIGGELFIIALDPLQERKLPEEDYEKKLPVSEDEEEEAKLTEEEQAALAAVEAAKEAEEEKAEEEKAEKDTSE